MVGVTRCSQEQIKRVSKGISWRTSKRKELGEVEEYTICCFFLGFRGCSGDMLQRKARMSGYIILRETKKKTVGIE